MLIAIGKYRIVSSDTGYKILKPKGKQWIAVYHYGTLEQAITDLFDYRVRTELKDFIVDFDDATKLEVQKTAFFTKIAEIKNEILEGLK